jgi:hypothetical protein
LTPLSSASGVRERSDKSILASAARPRLAAIVFPMRNKLKTLAARADALYRPAPNRAASANERRCAALKCSHL